MKKIRYIFIFLLVLLFPVVAKADNKIKLYLFYGDGCPHCAEEEKFFDRYLEKEKDVE